MRGAALRTLAMGVGSLSLRPSLARGGELGRAGLSMRALLLQPPREVGWFLKANSGQVETCLNLALLAAGFNDQQLTLDSR